MFVWSELRPVGGWEAFERSGEVTAFLWSRLPATDWHYLNPTAETSAWEHRGEPEGMVFVGYAGDAIAELRVSGAAGAVVASALLGVFGFVRCDDA
jgi:hypothetical protein